jgi:hypothetical protein
LVEYAALSPAADVGEDEYRCKLNAASVSAAPDALSLALLITTSPAASLVTEKVMGTTAVSVALLATRSPTE